MTHQTRTRATFAPPIPEARRWLDGVTFPEDRPLINLSQAAPVDPPPLPLRRAMAEAMENPDTHLYGPVLGNDSLRAALAENWANHYGAPVAPEQTAITQGCNQAFAATLAALTTEGDEVILPLPWYFNHKMWLDMSGVTAVPLATGSDLIPTAEDAAKLITSKTRAIALVSPNNPGGTEYPEATLRAFYDLAKSHGIRLILDETYRDFHSRAGAPHDLLQSPDWDKTLIQLYSFSKAYRLTGHRVGAIITDPALLREMEKFQDTVAICAPQMGQFAAEWGLRNLDPWVAEQRAEVLARRAAVEAHFPPLAAKGWRLLGLGAYFAYIEHPFAEPASTLAPKIVREAGVLLLPGSMFFPKGNDTGERHFRVAFANADKDGIKAMCTRLAALDWPLAAPKTSK
ncbi:aminotransferase [Pacificoceanicola onchidii]|uniref:aminotransferase n=1 Tax=Pacificoceanicola onchidii TaxID=2562685 RepID=UPI0010A610DD|nr:aminotransferase [Pacificoceanicola onchidii]